MPEFYIYMFLAEKLVLKNANERLRHWMKGHSRDEILMVAYALNTARNLDGSIPSVNEEQADALRRAQKQRSSFLAELRRMFPKNHQVLAYDLEQAVQFGVAESVAELLSRATLAADSDFRFWRARGWLFLRVQRYNEAKIAFEEALRLHSIDWRTRHYLADWARRTGNMPFAETQQRLATRGKSLETALGESADTRSVSAELRRKLADYVEECGEILIASRLREQLDAEDAATDKLDSSGRDITQSPD
jgi:tetratricopeptide (TPR) repeat protein